MARHHLMLGRGCDMTRGRPISLIAICLVGTLTFSAQTMPIEERPFARQVAATQEVQGAKQSLLSRTWETVRGWSVSLWKKIFKGSKKTNEGASHEVAITEATLDSVVNSTAYQKALVVVSDWVVFVETNKHLSEFKRNLDWTRVNPYPFLYRGTRGVPRTYAEAQKVWATIPEPIRASPGATGRFLMGKDWSHIWPHSLGGSNDAANGVWEKSSINRARGKAPMILDEVRAARAVLRSEAFLVTLQQTAINAAKGAVVTVAFLGVVAALELGLQWQQGEIDKDQFVVELGKTIGAAGLTGAAISGLVTAMALAFPVLIPVIGYISVPLAVVGFAALTAKVVSVGKGWYNTFLKNLPLKPATQEHWYVRSIEQSMLAPAPY